MLQKEINSVWVATVPRTGSMWTANIIREIFEYGNFEVFPKKQFISDIEWLNFYKTNVLFDQSKSSRFILKIHKKLTKIPPRSKIITNVRNPYDVCASYHEFMKCNLDDSIKLAQSLLSFINHYKNLSQKIFKLRYEEIETQPYKLLKKLALFLEISLPENEIKEICDKYNKSAIKKLINKNDSSIKLNDYENKNDTYDVLKLKDGNIRSFDLKTGFQTGHVSSRNTGEWRKIFTNKEIRLIIKKIDSIAIELGYNSETY